MIPIQASFMTGIKRVVNSAKVHAAVLALVPTYFGIRYEASSLPPNQRMGLWIAFVGAVMVIVREIINSWGLEDAAAKSQPASPIQVNTGSPSLNEQTTTAQNASPFIERGHIVPLDPTANKP